MNTRFKVSQFTLEDGKVECVKAKRRLAQLYTMSVSVVCPHCSEPQPNQDGSEMWIDSDFDKKHGRLDCVSCEQPILIEKSSKAQF